MDPSPLLRSRLRLSVYWRVAAVLVTAFVALTACAVVLSASLARERSLALAAGSVRLRLDALAEEIETRISPEAVTLDSLPLPLQIDLTDRFPDPVLLFSTTGAVVGTFEPAQFEDGTPATLPNEALSALDSGVVVVSWSGPAENSWAAAPLYASDGALLGGVLVQPLTQSLERELLGTREAFRRALLIAGTVAFLIALILSALLTWRLVTPLRRVISKVERIGEGDYTARIALKGGDEFARLALAVNRMAGQVEGAVSRLRETDRLRRELITNVGHDLRTPLAGLLGYIEEAAHRMDREEPVAAADALETAARQGAYLQKLIGDLFELSVLEGVTPPLRLESVLPAELLHEAERLHRAAYERNGVDLSLELAPGLPPIIADGVRLLRLVDNLLANALAHTSAGGAVKITATQVNDQIRVAVEDSGEGMTAEQVDHAFERYYRGSDARSRKGTGTGLGLAISRAIARAHGGELLAQSKPGEGTTLTLFLPLTPPPPDTQFPILAGSGRGSA